MKYQAHLSLSDTTIVCRVFDNTFPGNITWERLAAGQYEATLPDAYGTARIFLPNNVLDVDLEGELQSLISISAPNKVLIQAQDSVGNFTEWLNQFVQIEVFHESTVENFVEVVVP